MKNDNENLNELLKSLYNAEQAELVRQQIQAGDKLFAQFKTHQPDAANIEAVKQNIRDKITSGKHTALPRIIKFIAAAACILIAVSAGIMWMFKNSPQPQVGKIISQNITEENWFSDEQYTQNDKDLAVFEEQYRQLQDLLLAVKLDENGDYESRTGSVDELETSFIEIKTSFWEG